MATRYRNVLVVVVSLPFDLVSRWVSNELVAMDLGQVQLTVIRRHFFYLRQRGNHINALYDPRQTRP